MDRAVSDVLGYVLIFSLIIGSVGLVYVSGYGSLQNVRDAERFSNAERAFDVLDTNIDDIVVEHAPSRATEIKLSDASIGYGDQVTINVSFASGRGPIVTTYTPIRFAIGDDRELVYSNGAIIRSNGPNSVMRDEPSFIFGDRVVIPMIETRAFGQGVAGSSRVLVRAERSKQTINTSTESPPYNITIKVTTSRTDAWERYFEEETGEDCTVTGNTVSCPYRADAVYIQVTKVDIHII